MGSNGLTSARHDVLAHTYAAKYPEAFDPAVPEDLIFSGKYNLTVRVHTILSREGFNWPR